jgi:outer membrane protein assembly factor BamE (lipoprotein component of BamABCDE complex)
MNFHVRLSTTLLLIGALAGCAAPSAIQVGAAADEVQQRLGKPTEVLRGAQGGELWDYVYGPEGVETWRFDIDLNRKVGSATQLLTLERLYRVVPGVSTADDVKMLLGKPREIMKLGGETVWEWRVALPPGVGVFVVRFGPDGKVSGYNVLEDIKSDDAIP